ncbi:ATP-dependent DNA helicase RecG [Candidatus Parcubacteria bacterium]|nr:MAG: ATP-dependent DNA helicase RecG [Candidatus Parcubacteria bacterium]
MRPEDDITKHFRLISTQIAALRRLGLHTIGDLLRHFPARYEAAGSSGEAARLVPGTKVTLVGSLSKLKARKLWKSRRNSTEGWFEDNSGRVKVMWFNQPYMASYVPQTLLVKLSGTVGGKTENPYIANPEVEAVPDGTLPQGLFGKQEEATHEAPTVFPIYPESRGVTSKWFYHALDRILGSSLLEELEDPIPSDIRERYNLPDLSRSLLAMHRPKSEREVEAARKRFSFEEIFVIALSQAKERMLNEAERAFPITEALGFAQKFLNTIPFPPTTAQKRAIEDITRDFDDQAPMARLLEGDVGSGKTLVAAATAYAVVHAKPPARTSGTLQVGYMAPTEILAVQHFQSFVEYFSHLPINIALITGSGCKKFPSKIKRNAATDISRAQLLKWVANGEIAMLVGTHALIQKAVKFQHLAYVIVDEQHRFGTNQRRALAHKGDNPPHFLSMTATPIPRTLALTLYGDLDISVLDELPPGRMKVITKLIKPKERDAAYDGVRQALVRGEQAYVICPRIEEPDPAKWNALQAKSAKAEAKRLKKEVFPEYEVGLLHGSMKPKEKDEVMNDFTAGKIHILVATSVVEVGVNVPNATVILIEGAERFGLAQLHQLRGRVQRSSRQPYCFLLPETTGEMAMKRLKALEASNDGFKLAEVDLETRGAGDLFGRKQWGITDIGMEALKNPRLIQAAREEARTLIEKDPSLQNYPALGERVGRISDELHAE